MACSKSLAINQAPEEDMALDMAIYSSAQTCIYGVRGQYVYKFNATTGDKESEFRFVDDVVFSEASIVELGGFLYIGVWRGVIEDFNGSPNSDIYKVNYALNSSVALGLPGSGPFTQVPGGAFGNYGFTGLVTDGTKIYGYYGPRASNVFSVDPTNIAGALVDSFSVGENYNLNHIEIDAVNGVLWTTGSDVQQLYCKEIDLTGFEQAGSNDPANTTLGICVVPNAAPTSVKVYCVTGSLDILKANIAQAYAALPALSSFDLTTLSILQGDAKPMRIRYNPNDGLVYIPTWSNDEVEILNPATDTITAVKTGFTNPIDCVFTPSKKWAVQNSSIGLREIT